MYDRRPADGEVDVASDRADRIDVRTPDAKRISEIRDVVKIRSAIAFIKDHKRGWSESPCGPRIPDLMLHFYQDGERLGGFGISGDVLVADPITSGWLSRKLGAEENRTLLRPLGLTAAPSR